jgi:Leucine-rich repeat (LRR) protein
MKAIITKSNINDFSKGIFNDIIEIIWSVNELDRSVIKNFPNLQKLNCCRNGMESLFPLANCINLQKLYCNSNQIKSLDSLANCINLEKLYCHDNEIKSLDPLANCINLEKLYCDGTQITSLNSLANCINLEKLYCCNNQITSLNPLANCINLRELECDHNQITSLDSLANCINIHVLKCCYNQIKSLAPLANCINIKNLHCYGNQIKSLDSLANCINLNELDCCNNQIKSLDSLANCINLCVLDCSSNQITSLESLVYLRHLVSLEYYGNPLTIQSIQVQRFLDRFMTFNKNNSIYQDKQNIHDVTIQKTICDSLQSLLKDNKPMFSIDDIILSNLSLTTKESLIEYCQDESVHSIHLITYGELLGFVWQRIINSNHKEELLRILEEQMADSQCKCFTGRFNRTISVLVGFYDDIKINISDNARIGAIIIACKEKIKPYNSLDHKKMVEKELLQAGYNEEEIKPWIDAIDDE